MATASTQDWGFGIPNQPYSTQPLDNASMFVGNLHGQIDNYHQSILNQAADYLNSLASTIDGTNARALDKHTDYVNNLTNKIDTHNASLLSEAYVGLAPLGIQYPTPTDLQQQQLANNTTGFSLPGKPTAVSTDAPTTSTWCVVVSPDGTRYQVIDTSIAQGISNWNAFKNIGWTNAGCFNTEAEANQEGQQLTHNRSQHHNQHHNPSHHNQHQHHFHHNNKAGYSFHHHYHSNSK